MQDIKAIIEQTVIGMNYDLVDIEHTAGILCVYIDTLDINQNVSIDDCIEVSNQLTRIFEVDNIDYKRLEVSTPGIDRPLKKYEHYVKYIGHEVCINFRQPFEGKKRFTGIILPPKENNILSIETEIGKNIAIIDFTISEIDKAKLSLGPYFQDNKKTTNEIKNKNKLSTNKTVDADKVNSLKKHKGTNHE